MYIVYTFVYRYILCYDTPYSIKYLKFYGALARVCVRVCKIIPLKWTLHENNYNKNTYFCFFFF
jgi:hypothetical protein